MKKCPYCAEQIQDQAIKCRFCGEILDKNRYRCVCGAEVSVRDDECKACGVKFRRTGSGLTAKASVPASDECPKCGAEVEVEPNSIYCGNCSLKLPTTYGEMTLDKVGSAEGSNNQSQSGERYIPKPIDWGIILTALTIMYIPSVLGGLLVGLMGVPLSLVWFLSIIGVILGIGYAGHKAGWKEAVIVFGLNFAIGFFILSLIGWNVISSPDRSLINQSHPRTIIGP